MLRVKTWRLVLASGISTLLVFSLVLISCKKDLSSEVYSVSGIVYNDCSNTPFANREIQLVHYTSNTVECKTGDPTTMTDETGRFSFAYSDNCDGFSYSDEYQVVVTDKGSPGTVLINRIPGKSNVDVGAVYVARKSKVDVKINITSILPVDTLYFGVNATDFKTLYPVKSVESVYEFTAASQLYQNKNTSNTMFFALGVSAYKVAVQAPTSSNNVAFQDYGCTARIDSVSVQLP